MEVRSTVGYASKGGFQGPAAPFSLVTRTSPPPGKPDHAQKNDTLFNPLTGFSADGSQLPPFLVVSPTTTTAASLYIPAALTTVSGHFCNAAP